MLVQTFFLCIGIIYLSLFLSDLFISNFLSSNNALVFRLGQNLSSIPKFILQKQNISTYLTSIEHKAFISKTFNYSYLFLVDLTSFFANLTYFSLDLNKSVVIYNILENFYDRLPDTLKETKARIAKHGQHKLGLGGYLRL